MLRGLVSVLFLLAIACLALPFYMTSRALDEHGVTIPGKVYHKDEYVYVRSSSWELRRTITVEYSMLETGSTRFFDVPLAADQYDSLRTNQSVDVRYLPTQYLPELPGVRFLSEFHALAVARLANIDGVSRLAVFRRPDVLVFFAIGGGIVAFVVLWRLTHWRPFAWGIGIAVVALIGYVLQDSFPRRTPAPAGEVRRAAGHVARVGRIDRLFSGSRSRGVIAEQPIDVIGVEFVPQGRTEPVLAVDLIDRGSIADLKETSTVTVDYEADSPRTAYIVGATRRFPERNFNGAILWSAVYFGVLVGGLYIMHLIGRGFRRLISR